MRSINLIILIACFLNANIAFALRCGHSLVDLGDYKEDVYEKCGDPESIETHIERRGVRNYASGSRYFSNPIQTFPSGAVNLGQEQYAEIEITVEEWIYDFGRSRFKQFLRFENGKLKEIKNLGRGD